MALQVNLVIRQLRFRRFVKCDRSGIQQLLFRLGRDVIYFRQHFARLRKCQSVCILGLHPRRDARTALCLLWRSLNPVRQSLSYRVDCAVPKYVHHHRANHPPSRHQPRRRGSNLSRCCHQRQLTLQKIFCRRQNLQQTKYGRCFSKNSWQHHVRLQWSNVSLRQRACQMHQSLERKYFTGRYCSCSARRGLRPRLHVA